MSEWKTLTVPEFAEVISGSTPATSNKEYWDGDIEWVTPVDLSKLHSRYLKSTIRKISKFGLGNSSTGLIPANNVVMSSRAPIGYFAIPTKDFTTNQGCKSFKLYPQQDAEFHYYNFLLHIDYFKRFGSGSTFAEISKSDIEKLSFKIPTSLPEQRKIARILSTVDAVIEKSEAAIAKYKAIKSGMMRDLFTRGIDLKTGKLRPSYEDAPEFYKQSELGWVPKEWEVDILEEMAEITTGSTPPTSNTWNYGDDYMFVSPSDINENQFIQSTEKMLSIAGFLLCRKLPAKSICVVCIGSTIGKMAFTVRECATNQQINAVVPRNTNLTDFLYYAMLFYNGEQFRKETGLQAVPIVNKSNFSKFLLPLVEENEAISIAKKLFAIDMQLQTELANTHKYQQLKFALMSDLLTGKVRVKVSEP